MGGITTKRNQLIPAFIIMLVIVLQGVSAQTTSRQVVSLIHEVNALKTTIEACTSKISSRGETQELAQQIEELTRTNLMLEQENKDLRNQMKTLGWWKGD